MESAFGIDHGDISKGLPSAMRKPGFKTFGPKDKSLKAKYVDNRVGAHLAGRTAAKQRAKGQIEDEHGMTQWGQPYTKFGAKDSQQMGLEMRRRSREAIL